MHITKPNQAINGMNKNKTNLFQKFPNKNRQTSV